MEKTADFLVDHGIPALPYHAGLDARTRAANQSRFLREDGMVMVATIAFGMGIDKPDVRFVAHLDLPKSVEGYYQETGRAGRDGLPATAWLAYGLQDVVQQRRMIATSEGDAAHRRQLSAHLDAMLALCETVQCRRVQLLAYFGEASEPCGNCDTCLAPPESLGRHDRRPEAAVHGGAAAARAQPEVRRRADRRHPAGQADAAGRAVRPRLAEHVFGVGTDLRDTEWRGVVRQLLAQGLLAVEGELRHPRDHRRRAPACWAGRVRSAAPRAGARPRRPRSDGRQGRSAAADLPAGGRAGCSRRCAPGGPARPRSRACRPT